MDVGCMGCFSLTAHKSRNDKARNELTEAHANNLAPPALGFYQEQHNKQYFLHITPALCSFFHEEYNKMYLRHFTSALLQMCACDDWNLQNVSS